MKRYRLLIIIIVLIGIGGFLALSERSPKSPRLILLGLDGADWEIINTFISEGKLPTFKKLKEEGTWGYLQSLEPSLSPMLWTTIATGKSPDEHGIVDFLVWDEEKKERLPVTTRHRKAPAIWNIFTHHGIKSGVFNWLVTWPAEKIQGVLLSDRLGYHIFPRVIGSRLGLEQVSFPRDYAEKKKKLFFSPEKISYRETKEFIHISEDEFKEQFKVGEYDVQNPDLNIRLALATFKTFKNFALDYWKKESPPFMSLYFDIPDTLMHTFMEYAPPKLERVSNEKFEKYKYAVEATHRKIDDLLAEILDEIDSETHLMIVSDHGFKWGGERPAVPAMIGKNAEVEWHDDEGIILFYGKQFQNGKQIVATDLYDIVPTILSFFHLPLAEDFQGTIISSAFKPEFFNPASIRYVASYKDIPFGVASEELAQLKRDKTIDNATKEKLASLGYIDLKEEKNEKEIYQTRNPFLEAIQVHKAGRIDDALKLYLKILKNNPKTDKASSIHNALALIYRDKGNYEKAKKHIEEGVRSDDGSDVINILINLGNIEKHFKFYDRAREAYTKAMRKDPENGLSYYALGLLYSEQKQWPLAEKNFRKALERRLVMAALSLHLITALEKQKKLDEANRLREKFATHPNLDERFKFFIGESEKLISENRLREAQEALFSALRIQPKNMVLYNDIGGTFLKLNEKEKAISYFKRALELDPGYAISHLNLASAYLSMNQFQKAKESIQTAMKIEPKNKHAFFLLGVTQMSLRENRLAQFNLEKALKLDPGFKVAEEKLKELKKIRN